MNKCRICGKEIGPKYTDKVLRCNKCRKEVDYAIEEIKEENRKLKSDLSECECSFGFEADECGYWKREYKRLKKWIKDHCKGYGNLFPEDEMKRQWNKKRK